MSHARCQALLLQLLLLTLALFMPGSLACADWQDSLTRHNALRALHGSPALTWDATLAAYAQTWSNGLAANGCGLKHSSGPYGENLASMSYTGTSITPSCVSATNSWYNEVSNYKFTSTPWTDNGPNFMAIGHFTQVVWKNTARLGCATAVGNNNGWNCYVVTCSYGPPGNYVDNNSFLNNVLPVGGVQVALPPSPSPAPRPPPPPPKIVSPPPKSTPPPPFVCVDTSPYCVQYLAQNLCNNSLMPWVKNRYCMKTCKNCPVSTSG